MMKDTTIIQSLPNEPNNLAVKLLPRYIRHVFRLGFITFQRFTKILTIKKIFYYWFPYDLITITKAYHPACATIHLLHNPKVTKNLIEVIPQTPCGHLALTQHRRVQNLFQATP